MGLLVFSSTDRASFDGLKAMKRAADKMVQLQADGSEVQWAVVQHKVDGGLDEVNGGTGSEKSSGSPAAAAAAGQMPLHASPSARTARAGTAEHTKAASGTSVSAHSQQTVATSGGITRPRVRSAGLELEETTTAQPSVQVQPSTTTSLHTSSRASPALVDGRSAKSHRCVSTCVRLRDGDCSFCSADVSTRHLAGLCAACMVLHPQS